MQPFNPFLRAFFSSRLPLQASAASHVVLVPKAELLYDSIDGDSNRAFEELLTDEEFLASHVLRTPHGGLPFDGLDASTIRTSKTKARQYTTMNGRAVIIKDSTVFTNRGFKAHIQSMILNDDIYYADNIDSTQWLIYYISRPLLGTPQLAREHAATKAEGADSRHRVLDLNSLLSKKPSLDRVVKAGFEKLLVGFGQDMQEPASETNLDDGRRELLNGETSKMLSSPPEEMTPLIQHGAAENEMARMKRATETLVYTAIDQFQQQTKDQQLQTLDPDESPPANSIESLVESYLLEQLHEHVIFPTLCEHHRNEDTELERNITQMACVDILQVGAFGDIDFESIADFTHRTNRAVTAFQRIEKAKSPHAMLKHLLETQRQLTSPAEIRSLESEKAAKQNATNADTLVALLMIVVIRASVKNLHARLAYIIEFTFVSDVESGETGYALSTFEAVLTYLSHHSTGLIRISRKNRSLWNSIKLGQLSVVQQLLEPEKYEGGSAIYNEPEVLLASDSHTTIVNGDSGHSTDLQEHNLAHVFPFQQSSTHTEAVVERPRFKKKVSMDMRSMSELSTYSDVSYSSTMWSSHPSMAGETSADQLSKVRDRAGSSILMIAVEASQVKCLEYLLGLPELFSADIFLHDVNDRGVSLLSAAVQTGNTAIIDVLVNFVLNNFSVDHQRFYLKSQDANGRTVGHWFFNAPHLIQMFASSIPWTLKDHNGQSPLFAICRSYDSENYTDLVREALSAAAQPEGNDRFIRLNDHIDKRGNTLLHVIHDVKILGALLNGPDADPNCINDKFFTPLMIASKFGRLDCVKLLMHDYRVDTQARELRGFTATELAKDDEIRNQIDDMAVLVLPPPTEEHSRTAHVVRSLFVEEGNVRVIIKSVLRTSATKLAITTSRRTLHDFENLARWLWLEQPASWIPALSGLRSPFQIPSKASRKVLYDTQLRMDHFLRTLVAHPTFANHESLWEMLLVPDIDLGQLAERAQRKAEARIDNLREEFDPLTTNLKGLEVFVGHATHEVTRVQSASKNLLRRVNRAQTALADVGEAFSYAAGKIPASIELDENHLKALWQWSQSLSNPDASALTHLRHELLSQIANSSAVLHALKRPTTLIGSINDLYGALSKHQLAANRTQRWPSPLGLLDDSRKQSQQENIERAEKAGREVSVLVCELRYTQQTIATELAGWQEHHSNALKGALYSYAVDTLIAERLRLVRMKNALKVISPSLGNKKV